MPSRTYTAFGETKPASAWAKDPRCVVGLECLRDRFEKRWDIEQAITTKPFKRKTTIDIGPLRAGGAGRHHYPQRIELDQPQRVTNSSQRDPYTPPTWNVRAGASDHLQHRSLTK